jgi:hypothetical protein
MIHTKIGQGVKTFTAVVGLAAVAVAIFLGVKWQERVRIGKLVDQYNGQIPVLQDKFNSVSDDDYDKFNDLKVLEDVKKFFDAKQLNLHDVDINFANKIGVMKGYFTKNNDDSITEGTLSNVSESVDVAGITNAKNQLNLVLGLISKETPVVYRQQQKDAYAAKVNTLVSAYANRIAAVNDANAAAAKAKADEEAKQKAAAEQATKNAAAQKENNQGKSGNGGNSSNGGSHRSGKTYNGGSNGDDSNEQNGGDNQSGKSNGNGNNGGNGNSMSNYIPMYVGGKLVGYRNPVNVDLYNVNGHKYGKYI